MRTKKIIVKKDQYEIKMGRIYLEHIGGTRLFSCANCDTVLTNRNELVSTRFTGATGRAFLFHKAVNLVQNEIQERVIQQFLTLILKSNPIVIKYAFRPIILSYLASFLVGEFY